MIPTRHDARAAPARRDAMIFLGAALLLFTANLGATSLPPLDDCFYAQKAAEMAARPGMTVTWAGRPAYQNPPGQLWIMAASFRLFGASDAAARLPTALMAWGALAGTAWIGARLLSPAAGLAGAAVLGLAPFFLNNARRAMLEIPLLFWTVMALAALVAWRRRPVTVLLLAPTLAMAILTKSVLGLMPLAVAFAAACLLPAWRPLLRDARFWIAAALGVALGASWPLHQWLTHGQAFLDVHFGREITERSLAATPLLHRLLGYPAILLTQHQPEVLVALPATWGWLRDWRARATEPAALLYLWAWLPLVGYLLSAAQSARYVFPLAPALALVGGGWLAARWPDPARVFAARVVPAIMLLGAAILWVRPALLTRDTDRPFREGTAAIAKRAPVDTEVAFLGDDYWRSANPLLWYDGLRLGPSQACADAAITAARGGAWLLLCERGRLSTLPADVAAAPRLIETRDAVLIDLAPPR